MRCVDWAARAKEDEDRAEYDAERRTPVVDGETLSRAVEITRWFCESFENVLNVFADVERKPQTLATGEIWLERRIVEVVAKYAGGKDYAKNIEITPHIKALRATKKERTGKNI